MCQRRKNISPELSSDIAYQMTFEKLLGIPHQHEKLSQTQKELLRWHHRLGHMPFQSPLKLAKLGLIPRHLAATEVAPICASCTFAAAKKRPW